MSAGTPATVVVASAEDRLPAARSTVRSLRASAPHPCVVVDVDASYRPVADERVVRLGDLAATEALAGAATLDGDQLAFCAGVLGAASALAGGADRVVVLAAGARVVGDLGSVADTASAFVVPAVDAAGVLRRSGPLHSRALYGVRTLEQVAVLRELATDWRTAPEALDAFAVLVDAVAADPATVVGPWRAVEECHRDDAGRLWVDGRPAAALDLTAFDPRHPWLMDAGATSSPRVLLSQHPALAELAAEEASARLADEGPTTSGGVRMDAVLRAEARRAHRLQGELPDVLGLGAGPDVESWALGLVPEGDAAPVGRYLAAVRAGRPDLQIAFPSVPGRDSAKLARWALRAGIREAGLDADLLQRAAERTLEARRSGPKSGAPRSEGVNLVGYLAGELGLGESARLVDAALQAAGVETSTFDVSRDLESRRSAAFRASEPVPRTTSLICVNGAETPAVATQLHAVLSGTRVIGMWYWELEEFPAGHAVGLEHVDEVWAATEFMRAAIAERAGEVPVRTVTPPLPQAGADRGRVPEEFGIPTDRPWFLFTFDFLSRAPRKNPYGLVDAFTRAFGDRPAGTRPALVIKTINADRCPDDAERLRLQIAGRPDVLLVDAYLDNDQRHVLAANCTAFVSLHRAEGLGLTIAEAMAWGKPVITTAYGGVTEFCDEENSFLVDWRPGRVEETTGPYVEGAVWAEPDLDHAAELMRLVVDDPDRAAATGARAARDIREEHSVAAAGARMREALEQGDARWRAARDAEDGAPDPVASPPPGSPRARIAEWVARRRSD